MVPGASAESGAVVPITVAESQLRGLPNTEPARFGSPGSTVAQVGDVNGDGIADAAVAAPAKDARGRPGAGVVYVLFGGAPPGRVDVASAPGFRIDGARQGTSRPRPVFETHTQSAGARAGTAV